MTAAVAVTVACPACRDGADAHPTYEYARAYLCALHQAAWDREDVRAHRRGTCPHSPKACACGTVTP